MRWLVKIILLVGLFLSLILFSANSLLFHYAQNHKDYFEKLLSEYFEKKITIGSIHPQLFPLPQLVLEQAKVVWGKDSKDLIFLTQLELKLDLANLLQGKINFDQLSFYLQNFDYEVVGEKKTLSDFKFHAAIENNSQQLIFNAIRVSALVEQKACQLYAEKFVYEKQDPKFELIAARFKSKGLDVPFDLTLGLKNRDLELHATGFSIDLADSTHFLNLLNLGTAKKTIKGSIAGNLKYQSDLAENHIVKANLKMNQIDFDRKIIFKNAQLSNLVVNKKGIEPLKIDTKFNFSGLQINLAGSSYQSNAAQGAVTYQGQVDSKAEVKGQVQLANFNYNDGLTEVREVNGQISPFKLRLDKNSNIDQTELTIQAKNLELSSPSVKMSLLGTATSSLLIATPNGRPYQVTGDVNVNNANLEAAQKQFTKLEGRVDFSIAAAKKIYRTAKLNFQEFNRPAQIRGEITILPNILNFSGLNLKLFGGVIETSGSIGQAPNDNYKINLRANEINISELTDHFLSAYQTKQQAKIDRLDLDLSGRSSLFPKMLTGKGDFLISHPQAAKSGIAIKIANSLKSVPIVGRIFGSKEITEASERQTLSSKLRFVNNDIFFDEGKLIHQSYTLNGNGVMSNDLQINFKTELILLQKAASNIGLGIAPLEKIFGRAGRIVIPLYIKGQLPDYTIEPDVKTFLKDNSGLTFGQNVLNEIGSRIIP